MAEKIQLSKSDRQKVWWRSQFLQGSWNYERMQNLGWAYSLIPAIKKLYTKKEDQAAALERHLEFFNTHPYVAAPIMGVTLALEEERANGTEIDDAAIQGVKIGMMGPLAGIGDPVFWFTVRPILGALGASLAATGNIVGPLLFFFGCLRPLIPSATNSSLNTNLKTLSCHKPTPSSGTSMKNLTGSWSKSLRLQTKN